MAVLEIKGSIDGESVSLRHSGGDTYGAAMEPPRPKLKITGDTSCYPVMVTAMDEAGNKTVNNSTILQVTNSFAFDFIVASAEGVELEYMDDCKMDVDIGETNDFELTVSEASWNVNTYGYGNRIFIPETEYGGLVEDMEVDTGSHIVILRGQTWRGLLTQKVVVPPKGQPFRYLSGELNQVIRELISGCFGSLFAAEEKHSGIVLENWKAEPYDSLYVTIMKFLESKKCRLQIRYIQGEGLAAGKVYIGAVPVKDYSDELEYSQETGLYFNIRDSRQGINHLICGGAGELEKRLILHLYVQKDGSIGKQPYYKGLAERSAFFDCDAEDMETLEEDGLEELKKLQNYKTLQMSVDNIDLELGDIVGGREYITGTELKKPVVQKIFRKEEGKISVEYKLKGED